MSDENVAADAFASTACRVLAQARFVPPAVDEVCVLMFDSAEWVGHVHAAAALLDDGERRRAARFHFERDRSTYVLAHALWRLVLAVCLDVEPAAVRLASWPSGQPYLPGTRWATSLSHSGSRVAIGVGLVVALGVDIEQSPARIPLSQLMPTICTPSEALAMQKLTVAAREHALLQLWTRKEALLKAFGTGLLESLAHLSAATSLPIAPPNADLPPFRVRDMSLPGLVGALAAPTTADICRMYLPPAATKVRL